MKIGFEDKTLYIPYKNNSLQFRLILKWKKNVINVLMRDLKNNRFKKIAKGFITVFFLIYLCTIGDR